MVRPTDGVFIPTLTRTQRPGRVGANAQPAGDCPNIGGSDLGLLFSSGQRTRRRSSQRYESTRPFAATSAAQERASAPAARSPRRRATNAASASARLASRRRCSARKSQPSSSSSSARRRCSAANTARRSAQSSPLTTPASRDNRSHAWPGTCPSPSSSGAFVSTPSTSGRRNPRSGSASTARSVRPSSMSPSAHTGVPFSWMPATASCSCTSRAVGNAAMAQELCLAINRYAAGWSFASDPVNGSGTSVIVIARWRNRLASRGISKWAEAMPRRPSGDCNSR